MGRRFSPVVSPMLISEPVNDKAHVRGAVIRIRRAVMHLRAASAATLVAVLCAGSVAGGSLLMSAPASAQTMADRLSQRAPQNGKDRLLVQAKELVYNSKANSVGAQGNVQLYYQGRVLEADRVTYDRNNSRVYAEGHARLTEQDGTVAYADKFELTDDFKTGFIDSLKADTAEQTHMTAARAERIGGEATVLEKGTYTACEACKSDATRPPLWQVRAKRIIHQNSEQTIYYEDATFELFGMPIAYLPYFSSPDPSVKRKSGMLAPHYVIKDSLGVGIAVPLFWAIAPNMDLTMTPTLLSRQGLLSEAEFRHRLVNGSYTIRAAGIFQADPGAFAAAPYGPGNRSFRGSVDTNGEFYLNQKWKFGWDVAAMTDKWFSTDYKQPQQSLSSNYFRERTSQVYLRGQGDRGFFDLRGYHFQGLSAFDRQDQQPLVAPVWDYNKTFDIRPETTWGIGGQVELDFNLTSLSRMAAAYQSIPNALYDPTYHLFDICATYTRHDCLLRGIGGDYTRATLNASWKRQFIDPIGQVWTPFTFAHINGSWLSLNKSNTYNVGGAIITNADQVAFLGSQTDTFRGTANVGTGLEYRYPLMARTGSVTHVIEPIAQVIVRPDEATNRSLVNEDAQSLVFDDTNLFEWNKFSGYDRFEGGTRTNYGAQYTASFDGGGYFNALVGQSYQLGGRNSFASPDAANVGLSSGLDTRQSDFVTRAALAPNTNYSFIAKGRFDSQDYHLRRLDLMANARFGGLETSLQYARYEAQPLLGFPERREGLSASSKYRFDQNWYVTGNVIFDMSRHLYNTTQTNGAPLFSLAGLGMGAGYTDECATLSVNYTSIYQNGVGGNAPTRNQTVLLQLQLRTLGDTRIASSLANVRVQDGLGRTY
jgi:LPS-assembly protein